MSHPVIAVHRLPLTLRPDPSRVLVRPFLPTMTGPSTINPMDAPRALKILARILSLPEDQIQALLDDVFREFGNRHQRIRDIFAERFAQVRNYLPSDRPVSEERQLLIGSYFTTEYSLECAALFNPSIIPHPDQSNIAEGSIRIILSLRATGEGHISSITFRSGSVDRDGQIHLDPASRYVTEPRPIHSAAYERELFLRKLTELSLNTEFARQVLDSLGETFTLDQLRTAVETRKRHHPDTEAPNVGAKMILLARSNYEIAFGPDQPISERIIFPFSPSQSNGLEDARFVCFRDDDGPPTYYATYTAYDGRTVLPQLLETQDFLHFKVCTLNGPAVHNKGMAMFPRKIHGLYCMLSRQDNENIHVMFSEHPHFWYDSQIILRPAEPWEFVQLGNCGSPIETDAGWLVITHGVGAMRKYCIGAVLLDHDDPARVIGRLSEPLIKPESHEREGYVPNVVYTCGGLVHRGQLILPYAVSDSATSFAVVALDALIGAMR
ncbi:MAG TPA: glycoside hydrolase family 130 protein [Terrimicrobiaceae bacterium]